MKRKGRAPALGGGEGLVFCLQKTKSGTPAGVPHAVADGAFAAVLWAGGAPFAAMTIALRTKDLSFGADADLRFVTLRPTAKGRFVFTKKVRFFLFSS